MHGESGYMYHLQVRTGRWTNWCCLLRFCSVCLGCRLWMVGSVKFRLGGARPRKSTPTQGRREKLRVLPICAPAGYPNLCSTMMTSTFFVRLTCRLPHSSVGLFSEQLVPGSMYVLASRHKTFDGRRHGTHTIQWALLTSPLLTLVHTCAVVGKGTPSTIVVHCSRAPACLVKHPSNRRRNTGQPSECAKAASTAKLDRDPPFFPGGKPGIPFL